MLNSAQGKLDSFSCESRYAPPASHLHLISPGTVAGDYQAYSRITYQGHFEMTPLEMWNSIVKLHDEFRQPLQPLW